MKLFKRTSIFLTIVIILLWTFILVWVNYPLNNIRTTDVEKQQTIKLIKNNDMKVAAELLDLKIKAVPVAKIQYLAESSEIFEEALRKGNLQRVSDNVYKFDNSSVRVSGKTIIIEGETNLIEKVTSDTAMSKSRALIEWLGLWKKDMAVYVYEKMDGFLISYVPEYKGKRIFDCKINVMLYGQSRYKVEFIPYELDKTGEKQLPKSACAVLSELALSGQGRGETVEEMNLGYKIKEDSLKPAWEVKTKSKNVFYVE